MNIQDVGLKLIDMKDNGRLAPKEVRTEKQLLQLQTDNWATKDFWILIGTGIVYLHEQRSGQESKQSIKIKRADFNRLVNWYCKQQKKRKK